ncbi:type II toxin-antitoxin system RelE/ParE family toxin [Paracoccus kondratievae]|uniref:type II toxin-antitoxin system RelE/ParE family toxin n=1 Tax=Paracoccus kondratievae TaxID=135740 RepID=UPI001D0D07EB|nr:type II toxin-antitoxin system RelE/ParE family toxin [Paracoccus kondratievae]
MKALAFTVAATVDLGDIRDYTEGEWSLAQARRYVQELRTGAGRWHRVKGAAEKWTFGQAI